MLLMIKALPPISLTHLLILAIVLSAFHLLLDLLQFRIDILLPEIVYPEVH